ncbi:MAG TPA: hypothetical protein VEC57_20285 [Candidatus Limnocylindrales bacterium]|nr:hypothetical protein [Candidatus Limnocylindrales bacterium]
MSTASAAQIEWGECWLEPAALPAPLEAEIKAATGGMLLAWGPRLGRVPWVVRTFAGSVDGRLAHMPLRLWDLIHFAVSQDNSCRYCYGATRTVLRVLGYKDDMIDRIERDAHLADLTAAEVAALRFARKLSNANPRPAAADMQALLDAGLTRAAISEIAACSAFSSYSNRLSTMFALPPESMEHMLDNPLMRLARPLLARKFRLKRHAPFALPVRNDPPFVRLVRALDGCYAAHLLRSAIDESLASPVLPRRSKLLMVAVIGRALSCDYVEEEARRELQAEGLGSGEVTQILTNLASPRLDAREALLVPYARETVRYRPIEIQAQTRKLAASLPAEEVIEAAGMAATANSAARLSVLLQMC